MLSYHLKPLLLLYISILNINRCLHYLNLIFLKHLKQQQQLLKYLHFNNNHISMRHLQLVPFKILYLKYPDHQTKINFGMVLCKTLRVARRVVIVISYLNKHSNSMQHSKQRLNRTFLSNHFQV